LMKACFICLIGFVLLDTIGQRFERHSGSRMAKWGGMGPREWCSSHVAPTIMSRFSISSFLELVLLGFSLFKEYFEEKKKCYRMVKKLWPKALLIGQDRMREKCNV
jgi:hypothetical protein